MFCGAHHQDWSSKFRLCCWVRCDTEFWTMACWGWGKLLGREAKNGFNFNSFNSAAMLSIEYVLEDCLLYFVGIIYRNWIRRCGRGKQRKWVMRWCLSRIVHWIQRGRWIFLLRLTRWSQWRYYLSLSPTHTHNVEGRVWNWTAYLNHIGPIHKLTLYPITSSTHWTHTRTQSYPSRRGGGAGC